MGWSNEEDDMEERTWLPNYSVLTPAYGRKYTTAGQMSDAWKAGKDWCLQGPSNHGTYASVRDQKGGTTVELKCGKLVVMYKMG
jgi:hypothetical protein